MIFFIHIQQIVETGKDHFLCWGTAGWGEHVPTPFSPLALTIKDEQTLTEETEMIARIWMSSWFRDGWGGRAANAAVGSTYFGF